MIAVLTSDYITTRYNNFFRTFKKYLIHNDIKEYFFKEYTYRKPLDIYKCDYCKLQKNYSYLELRTLIEERSNIDITNATTINELVYLLKNNTEQLSYFCIKNLELVNDNLEHTLQLFFNNLKKFDNIKILYLANTSNFLLSCCIDRDRYNNNITPVSILRLKKEIELEKTITEGVLKRSNIEYVTVEDFFYEPTLSKRLTLKKFLNYNTLPVQSFIEMPDLSSVTFNKNAFINTDVYKLLR